MALHGNDVPCILNILECDSVSYFAWNDVDAASVSSCIHNDLHSELPKAKRQVKYLIQFLY